MRLPSLIVVALLVASPVTADSITAPALTTLTFSEVNGLISFSADSLAVTAVDCPGTLTHCLVQITIPPETAYAQCTGTARGCPPTASANGVTVQDVFTFRGSIFGVYSTRDPGVYIENGNFGIFPIGMVGLGRCVDYYQGCEVPADGQLHAAFTWNYYANSQTLEPPFPLLATYAVQFQAAPAVTAVPEPTSLLLLGSGLVGWVSRRRRYFAPTSATSAS